MKNKQEILGQYFTKLEIVRRLLDLFFNYKKWQTLGTASPHAHETHNTFKKKKQNPT